MAQAVRDPAPPPAPLRLAGCVQTPNGPCEPEHGGVPSLHSLVAARLGRVHHPAVPAQRGRGLLRPMPLPGDYLRGPVLHAPQRQRHSGQGVLVPSALRPQSLAPPRGPDRLDRRDAPPAGSGGGPAQARPCHGHPRRRGCGRKRPVRAELVAGGGVARGEWRALRCGLGLVARRLGLPGGVPRHRAVPGKRHGIPGVRAGVWPRRAGQHARVPARPAARCSAGGLPFRGGGALQGRDVWHAHARDQQHAVLHQDPPERHGGLHAPPVQRAGQDRQPPGVGRLEVHELQCAAALAQHAVQPGGPPVRPLLRRHHPQHAARDIHDVPRLERRHVQRGGVGRHPERRQRVGPGRRHSLPGL